MEISDNNLLLKAVAQRKIKLVKVLVHGGVDVNNQGYDGKTPLIIACSFVPEEEDDGGSLLKLLEILLQNGASANMQDFHGRTAIMYAFRHGLSTEVIDILLNHGADLNITDNNGMSAFDFISDTLWCRYKHVVEKSKQYSHTVAPKEENNNVINLQCTKHQLVPRISIQMAQNSGALGVLSPDANSNTFRRLSDNPAFPYSSGCASMALKRRTGNYMLNSGDQFSEYYPRPHIERVLSDPNGEKRSFIRRSSSVFPHFTRTRSARNLSSQGENKADRMLSLRLSPSDKDKQSEMLVKVSPIDKSTVDDGIMKTMLKLPPITVRK